MIKVDLDKLLHQRIITKCKSLYENGHYPQAAFESMKQVELALKEKTETEDGKKLFGSRLVNQLFGSKKGIKLNVSLGDEMQKQAKLLFEGAFSYYRNYAAHDGNKIDGIICFRIMILASELLDIIGASVINFKEIGGVKGLIEQKIFENEMQLYKLLSILSSQIFPDETFDGMFEELAESGFSDQHYQAVFDLGLVEYHEDLSDHNVHGETINSDIFGWFELTSEGRKILAQIQNSNH